MTSISHGDSAALRAARLREGVGHHKGATVRLWTPLAMLLTMLLQLSCQRSDRPVDEHAKPVESSRSTAAARQPASMIERGTVVDRQGQPLYGARVRIKGRAPFVLTDKAGEFLVDQLVGNREVGNGEADESSTGHRVTASKAGYLIHGAALSARPLRIELQKLPTLDNSGYTWVDPAPDETDVQRCGNCHQAIYQQWQAGGHARSGNNDRFLDLYVGRHATTDKAAGWGLLTDYPEGQGVCSACHLPSADMSELGTSDLRDILGVAQTGVHCDFCHKIQDVDVDSAGFTHGRFAMTLLRPIRNSATNVDDLSVHATTETGQLFFGPLDDVDRGEDSHLPLQSTSEFCAACHEGIVFGVPVYTTYSEWLRSPARAAGKQCQACHMKPDGELTNIADGFGGIERDPLTLASHTLLPGGREVMLRRCLNLTASAIDRGRDQSVIEIAIRTHDVGHRVPTGFVDRHLLLVVEAFDAADRSQAPIGGPRLPPAAGTQLQGQAGVLFAKLLSGPAGESPVPFWAGGATAEDTRLDPEATSSTQFVFPPSVVRARVRLLYRRFWQQTVDEKGWDDDTIVVYDVDVRDTTSRDPTSRDPTSIE